MESCYSGCKAPVLRSITQSRIGLWCLWRRCSPGKEALAASC